MVPLTRRVTVRYAGARLRRIREQLGLTMRDVYQLSREVASVKGNQRFIIPPSGLSLIENGRLVPTIYRLYTLAVAYEYPLKKALALYGIAE